MPMPEVNLNCYILPNIENSDKHSQDTAIYLVELLFIRSKSYFTNLIILIDHF